MKILFQFGDGQIDFDDLTPKQKVRVYSKMIDMACDSKKKGDHSHYNQTMKEIGVILGELIKLKDSFDKEDVSLLHACFLRKKEYDPDENLSLS
jgi:hypothetical protein